MPSEPRDPNDSLTSETAAVRPNRRKWRYRLAMLLAIALCLALAHPLLLRAAARMLIVDQPAQDGAYLWLIDPAQNFLDSQEGNSPYDLAARWYWEDRSRRILLIEAEWPRLVASGITPAFEATSRRQLEARGVDPEAIAALDTPRRFWQAGRRLGDWLRQRPDGRVLVFCDRFRSRYHRLILDAVLAPDQAARVMVAAVPDREVDEGNWWKSRKGAKEFFGGLVTLAYAWCHGEDTLTPPAWNPDHYEAALRASRGAAP